MATECCECGGEFPENDIIMFGADPVCAGCRSLYVQKLGEGLPVGSAKKVWQDQVSGIIFVKNAPLPWRCCKCGGEPENALPRNLYWHHPALYIALLLNVLVYVILALTMRKTAQVQLPLCQKHADRRKHMIYVAWGLVALSVLSIILAIRTDDSTAVMIFIVSAVILFIAGLITGVLSAPVRAKKIGKTHVWLAKYAHEVRAELPVWKNQFPE